MNTVLPTVCWVRALHDYNAEVEGDLTLKAGDIIQVHDNDGEWWKGTLIRSQEYGTFPSNFIELMTVEQLQYLHQYSPSKQGHPPSTTSVATQSKTSTFTPHSRQASYDSTKYTKRKPVTLALSQQPCYGTANQSTTATSQPTNHTSAPSRRNPQAIVHHDILDCSVPSEPSFPNHNQNIPLPVPPVSSVPASPMTRLTQKLVTDNFNDIDPSQTNNAQSSVHSRRSSITASLHQELLNKDSQDPPTPRSTKTSFPGAWPEPTEEENHASVRQIAKSPKEIHVGSSELACNVGEPIHISNEAVYDPDYSRRNAFRSMVSSRLDSSVPAFKVPSYGNISLAPSCTPNQSETFAQSRAINRKSMPNLGLDDLLSVGLLTKSKVQRAEQNTGIPDRSPLPGGYNLQETDQVATSTSNGFPTSVSTLPLHSSTSDTHSAQITHPKPIKANCSKPFSPPPLSNLTALTAKDQHQLRRNSFSNFSVMASVPTPKEQQLYQERFQQQLEEQENLTYSNSIHRPEPTRLTLENLSRQSWSPGIHVGRWQENQQTGQQEMSSKSQASSNQQLHTRSRSQASFHSHTSPAIQSQEQQHQQTNDQHPPKAPTQLYHDSSIPLRSGANSGIDIPNTREPSSHNAVNISDTLFEENLNTASSPPFSHRQSMPVSPPTPSTVVTAITSGTPDWSSPRSMGTPASDASILMGMVSPSSSYHVRNRLSLSSRTAIVRHSSDSARGDSFSHDVYETGVDIESLDNPDPDNLPMHVDGMIYQACKPKATLIRAIKQIINPRKVAEKDAIKSQQDHFAWVEMQKSLKRVRSPEPGSKSDFHQQYFPPTAVTTPLPFSNGIKLNSDTAATNIAFADVDPFEALKFSHNLKDTSALTSFECSPSSFIQVDKLARNVNQKSPQLTPQMLSQKFLTRPYARSPLLKLRVLFIWVSENIRLEGGPMRDVSGGRYKLGPVGDIASTYYPAANGSVPSVATSAIAKAINQTLSITSPISTRKTPASSSANLAAAATVAALSSYGDTAAANNALSDGTHPSAPVMSAATAAAFMQGMEDCSKCFLAEDEPECAQEVLTNRVCRTGEGFANLFAEMAVAAGITDVGVVKGHLKGPMDVFAKEIPPPNHAWNVVKIDGAYRFIDCCLASPFYPGHYPNKSKEALSFYFLTSPNDLILTHYPVFMSYQYLSPPITPSVFLQLPFVRPPFFDYNLRFLDFKKRTCLDIRDDQPVEVLLVIGAGEGIDLRAEVEAMTAEGKVVKKRALAQVTVWRPNSNLQGSLGSGTSHAGNGEDAHSAASIPHVFPLQGTKRGQPISQLSALAAAGAMATVVPLGSGGTGLGNSNINRLGGRSGAGTSGIRIAKIKAILPPETVACAGSIRKGVLHIYAGRKVENALADAMPYSLAISLPIRHTGTLPKTPFSFVLPHFSPYEYYIKSPQTELLYYPHTYKFSVLSLAALSQAAATPIINPIHWTDLSPSSSMAIEPVSPAPDSATSQTPPISSLASPPPLPLSHSSTAATTAGGTSGRAWTSNSGTVGGIQMRNSAAMGSSASVGSAASSSLKLTADQVSTRLSGTNNGNASMTTSGPKPSFIDQRRTSLQYNGYTSHQQQILPPVPSSHTTSTSTAQTPSTMLSPNSAVSSSLTSPRGTSKLHQYPSTSSLASSLRPPYMSHNLSASSSSATLGAMGAVGRRMSSSSASSVSSNSTPSASTFAQSIGNPAIPRPERLVLRSQSNRIYKLVYDPFRQCHEAQIEIKERGLWECVRLDDGGKGRVGREGASGVVIASWRCV